MNKRVVVTVAAGAALTIALSSCGGKEGPEVGNPPEPSPPAEPAPPVAPEEAPVVLRNPPPPLPTWEESKSSHPEGATNPPYPVLVVTPGGGTCYKQWVSPMMRPDSAPKDRIDACTPTADDATPCGEEIACPPEAQEILAGRPTNPGRSSPK